MFRVRLRETVGNYHYLCTFKTLHELTRTIGMKDFYLWICNYDANMFYYAWNIEYFQWNCKSFTSKNNANFLYYTFCVLSIFQVVVMTVFPIPTNIDYTTSTMHAFYTFIGMFGIAWSPDIEEGWVWMRFLDSFYNPILKLNGVFFLWKIAFE